MALTDYSYVAPVGHTCAVTFQVRRAAQAAGLPIDRCYSPFDWVLANLGQVRAIVADEFAHYLAGESITASNPLDPASWMVTDPHGAVALHHLHREPAAESPTGGSWYQLGRWVGDRVRRWHEALRNPGGNVLFVRAEDPFTPDELADVLATAHLFGRITQGRSRLLWVRCDPPTEDRVVPNVTVAVVRRPWPAHLVASTVEWKRDYGQGIAWKGNDEDWDAVWRLV